MVALPIDPTPVSSLAVALYARLSRNPDGTSESVATQLSAGRRYCEATWPGRAIVEFSDDNLSGADDSVVRPGYDAMIEAIRRGLIGAVASKMQSRVTRQPAQWDTFRAACLRAGIEDLHTWTKGTVGLGAGRSISGRIMNLIDAEYVEGVRLAVTDALAERAAQGRPAGGRPFGYRHGRNAAGQSVLEIVPEDAAVVEQAARDLLAGHSLAAIARGLDERGLRTARGKQWNGGSLKSTLTSPAITGLRTYRGAIVGEGNWEPILDRDVWHAVQACLSRPRTVTKSNGVTYVAPNTRRPARRYVYTGFAVCGHEECGTPLVAQVKVRAGGRKASTYGCSSTRGGCDRLSVVAEPFEAEADRQLMKFLDDPVCRAYLAAGDVDADKREALEREKATIEQRRTDAAIAVVRDGLSPKMAAAIEQAVDEELARVDELIAQLTPAPVTDLDPDEIKADWENLDLAEKRGILRMLGCRVTLMPATRTRPFDPTRVKVTFEPQQGGVPVPAGGSK